MELLFDDVVDPSSQLIDVVCREIEGWNRLVDDDISMSLVEQLRTGWPDFPRPGHRDRNHRQTCRDSHPERPLLERMQSPISAPGSLGEHNQRVTVDLRPGHPFVYRRIRLGPGTPIYLDHAGDVQRLSEDGYLVQLLLREVADRGRDRSEQQWHVEVRQMIRQEEVLRARLHILGPTDRVAHRWDPEEDPTPQLNDSLAGAPHPEGHEQNEDCRDHDREQHEKWYRDRRFHAEQDLSRHRGSVVDSGKRIVITCGS